MQPDKAPCNREPEYKDLISGHSEHIGAPSPATDSVIDPAPDSKVDPYQDPAYNQPHPLVETPKAESPHPSPAVQACVDECLGCQEICRSEATRRSHETTEPHASHFRLMLNCAEICGTSANFLLSNSPFHGAVCGVCAEVCEACAQGCDEMELAACAAQCRKCADSCRQMAAIAV